MMMMTTGKENKKKKKKKEESKVVMCAREALSQDHPRFSLDGKDAMYRSSFRNEPPRRSVCLAAPPRGIYAHCSRPCWLAGQRVVWATPGVVAKLMGLDAIPIPLFSFPTK